MKHVKKGDIVIASVAVVLVILLAMLLQKSDNASFVSIRTPDTQYIYNLSTDGIYRVQGLIGESVIEVRSGEVAFIDSPCSGHNCIEQGFIQKAGAFSACLPNGISISITGDQEVDDVSI